MALNFPSSPSINDTYTYGDKTWVWNGRFWQIQAAGAINDIAIGNITPNTGAFTTLTSTGNITAAGNISADVLSGNFYANSILPWSPTAGLIDDAVDIGNSSLYFKDIYVGNVITPAGNQGNATQIQPASGAGQSGVAFVDAITGSATDVSAGTLYVESIDGTGNVTVDTFVEANEIIALSNVSGTGGNFSANVTAAYFLGNGAFLTGISVGSSYSNANVAAYLPNYQGLISNVDFRSTSPAAVAMVVTDRPITIGGNTLSYVTIPNDGNANSVAAELTNHGLGNVLISSGPDDYEWVFDNSGNLLAPGNIQAGNAVSANYFLGNGALLTGITTNYSNANVANYLATYNGNALFSNVTVSKDAVILGNLRVEGNTTYINVNDLVVDDYLVIIGNAATQVSDLNGAGLQIGNLANSNIQFVYDYTGNVMTLNRGANIANVLNVSGNVTANNFVGSGSNVTLAADSYTWIFNNSGNLELPGNTFAVNYANGTAVSLSGTYSNTNVANYLASNANVTVLVGTGNITTQGNVTGNYFIGNGALLTGIVTSSYSNANVANYLPTYSGNVTAGNISVTGNVTANWFVGNINTTNSLVTSGNVTANNFVGSDPNVNLIAGSYTWSFNDAGNLVLPSNTFAVNYANGTQVALGGSYSNSVVANYLASNANVTITVGVSNITTQGNISGNYFIGNGALLTGVVTSSYSNANVANYLPTYTGNITAGNIAVTGNVTANWFVGNINTTNSLVTSGNITANNFIGSDPNVGLVAGNYTWLFDNAGNVTLPSNTFAVNYANGTAVSLGGTYSNADVANYLPTYNGNALFSNVTVSRDAVILGNLRVEGNTTYINVSDLIVEDKDIIVAANASATMTDLNGAGLQIGNRSAGGNITFFYNSTSNVMTLSHGANIANVLNVAGNITATGNVNTGNLVGSGTNVEIVGGSYTWTFNGSGNLVLPGNTFAVNYANGTQVALAGSYSNTNVKAYLGNFDGNIIPSANVTYDLGSNSNRWNDLYLNNSTIYIGAQEITANADSTIFSGNIAVGNLVGTGDNVDIKAGAYTWRFDNAGNLTLPANTSAINYANGATVPVGYGNASVAAYLGSNANLTILSQGNITGNYFIGNGALLTGVVTSSYSNANVANYLPTYTGNIAAGNVTATGNVQGAYILGNGALLTGLPATYGNSNVAAYLASNANVTLAIGTGNITTQGNLAVGNLIGSGDNVDLKAGSYTWRFDSTGNLTLPANSTAIYYANGTQVPVGYGNANVATYLASNAAVTILTTANITTSANISGAYILGNGALLTGLPSTYGNSNVAAYLAAYNGNALFSNITVSQDAVILGNLRVEGNTTYINVSDLIVEDKDIIVAANASATMTDLNGAGLQIGNRTAGGNITFFYNSTSNVMSLSHGANVANVLNVSGNVTANNFIGSEANTSIVASAYTWTFNSAGNLVLPSNTFAVNYANGTAVSLGGSYSNADVANYLASNSNVNILTTGNITGNYILGNGALLTGLPATYSNANVANYLPTYTGNLSAGNYTGSGINVSIVAGTYTWSFNDLGNFVLPGNTFSVNYANGTQVALAGSYSNSNVAAYLASNSNVNILTTGNITGNYILGNGALLSGLPATYSNANVANYLPTYTGNLSAGNYTGSGINVSIVAGNYIWSFNDLGNLVLPSNSLSINYANGAQVSLSGTYANSNVAAYLASNANVTVSVGTGNITTQGNITGNYFIGNGALLTGVVTSSYSNANVANYLPTYTGNIGAGNISVTGVVNSGNVTANNFIGSEANTSIVANIYTWTFNSAGNLVLPGNTFAVNYANGTAVSLGASSSYGNSDVANYLVTYNANALFSNVTVSRDMVILGNLRVEGNTTEINVSNIFLADKDIIVAANANATLSDLNGAGLQIGNRTAGGNITFFYNSTSNVMSLSHGANIANVLNVDGNIVATGNITGNYILGNGAFLTGLPATYGNSNVAAYLASNANITLTIGTGNITTQGNVVVGNLIGSGDNVEITAGAYTWTLDNTGNLTLPGNTTAINYANGTPVPVGYGNANVATYLASNANVTVSVGISNITTQGNISGNYFIGNGALLTGVVTSSYSNANVANYLPTYTGNVSAGNLNLTGNIVDTGAIFVITGASGNVVLAPSGTSRIIATTSGANVIGNLDVAGNVNANGATLTGNLAVGNLIGSGDNVEITAGAYTWTLDNTGNLTLPGNSTAIYYANGTQVPVGYGNANVATYLASNAAVTILTTGNITSNANIAGNYILGNGAFLTGIAAGYGNSNVKTYLGNFDGNIIPSANVTYDLGSNSNRWNDLYLNNSTIYIGAQEITANASATIFSGNIAANYILGNGALLTGVASSYGNANVADYLASNANITLSIGTGNITTQGNISVGSIQGSNANTTIVANVYSWTFDDTGNLTLPGNSTAIYYANGTQVPIGYDNASVANYMGSNAAITILTTANITTQGNIAGNYFVGNGALLTGIISSSYTNANVANYLVTYNANALFSNVTVSQDAVILGNLRVEGNTTYINVTDLIVEDKDIIVAANANAAMTDLNGAGLQIGNRSAGGNITFFYNSTSNVMSLSHGANIANILNVAGNVTATGNVNTGNLVGSGTNVEIVSGAYTWTFDGAGNLTGTGNVSAGNFVGTSGNTSIVTAGYTWTFNDAGNLVLPGNTFGVTYANGTTVSLGGSYSNADVANYLPTYTGNITAGNVIATGNVIGNWFVGNINTTNSLVTSGNITANNFIGSAANTRIVANIYTWTFDSAGNLSLPSNSFSVNYANGTAVNLGGSYSNADVANYLPTYTGNISAGNITTTGNITTNNFIGSSGNTSIVTAGYTWVFDNAGNLVLPGNTFSVNYANGTQVALGSGSGSYSNANVQAYLGNFDGNIIPSANVTYNLGSNSNRWNDLYLNNSTIYIGAQEITANADSTVFSGNISANYIAANISTTGNITAGNFVGSAANTRIVASVYTWTFNSAGNLVLPGNTFSINYANGTQVTLGGSSSYSNADVANYLPTFTGNLGADNLNITGNIIDTGALNIITGASGNITLAPGNSNVLIARTTGANITGTLGVTGNVDAGNFNVTGNIVDTGALTIITGASGNITLAPGNTSVLIARTTGANITGTLGVTGNITGGNITTTIVSATGNVSGGNITTTGVVTATGNITGGNIVTSGIVSATGNVNASNLNVTGNIVDTGALTIITGASGNVSLAPGNTSVLVATTTGVNVAGTFNATGSFITAGNVTANNLIGTGVNTSIVSNNYTWTFNSEGNFVLPGNTFGVTYANGTAVSLGGSYGNADVGSYLQTYNGNALFSNITVSRDAVVLGNLRVEGNTTYINVTDLVIEDKDIIVAANANATLSDLNGAGLQIGNRSAGGNITFFYDSTSNVMSLSHGANIANILNVAGNITANSLVGVGTNVELVGGSYTWTFNGSGNLVLPGNTFAVNYANGAQVSLGGSYSNAEVASYLASNANVTILTGVANITTQGNVTAGYFLGNATFAEGVSNTYFGNVSPSSPAQGDIWINSDTAVQLIYFVDANGGQWAEMGAATSISSDGDYTDSNVIALLSSLGGNTISSSANITTTANIQGDYILGNGYFLSGITGGGSYGNANVANYLPTYTGNITAGNISVTGNLSANYIIGNGSQISNITFANITEFATAALTVDELYLQAVTRLGVTASGASGYVFDQYGAGLNPVLYATSGETIAFNLNVAGHPFLIQTSGGSNYSNGLVHVTTTGTVTTGASAQGQVAGTLYWQVPYGITGNYKYQCSIHGGMQNAIVISDGNVANLTVSSAATANTVTTAAQPNITSVGNLTSLIVTGNITGNTEGFTIGYRDVPQVSWSNATMALADASKHYYTSTGGVTLTVPSNANVAFPIGATVAFYNRSSANCTIAPQASVNIFLVGNSTITPTANRTITSNGGGTLTKVDTNTWMLSAANVV